MQADPIAALRELEIVPGERLLSAKDLRGKVGVGVSTIYRWIDAGTFPPPISLGTTVRWRESVIDRWIAERPTVARRGGQLGAR